MIITISRETGRGGHTVGKMLAERLGYAFYDKEIIQEVAREMHLDEKTVLENGETMSDQTYMDMVSGYIPFSRKEKVLFEEIKRRQDQLIERIAEKGNCVIVGRGSDYILAGRFTCLSMRIWSTGLPVCSVMTESQGKSAGFVESWR